MRQAAQQAANTKTLSEEAAQQKARRRAQPLTSIALALSPVESLPCGT
jgi:hypothetical protein